VSPPTTSADRGRNGTVAVEDQENAALFSGRSPDCPGAWCGRAIPVLSTIMLGQSIRRRVKAHRNVVEVLTLSNENRNGSC